MPLPAYLRSSTRVVDIATREPLPDPTTPRKGRGPQPKRGAAIMAGTDYPTDWSGFVGQDEAKEVLAVHTASARARGVRLDHVLIASGLHGVGKTTLAHILASKADVGLHEVSGVIELDKARTLLETMQDGDILFIDEIHLMISQGKSKAEWLLPFMTEGKLYTPEGAIDVPDVTIVGATTDAGRLPETILSRFMVRPKIVPYTEAQSAGIAENLASRMAVTLPAEAWPRIARASSGNPRDMRSILTAARDLALAFPDVPADLAKAIRWAGFSEDGLSQIARDMLAILRYQPDNRASKETIQGMLGEPGPIQYAERELLNRALVAITGKGRQLTDDGIVRADRVIAEELR